MHQLRLKRRSLSALYRDIQRQEGTGAPRHSPDVSLRGAKRRGNLTVQCRITGNFRRKRDRSQEIATAPLGPRNDKSGSAALTMVPCTEWAVLMPLRAQGAASAFGLLAMTIRGPLPFYRQPVRIVSAAPGAACRSPTTHDWQFCVTFHFPFCIFHLHHASPLRFALHFITKNCRTRVGAAAGEYFTC